MSQKLASSFPHHENMPLGEMRHHCQAPQTAHYLSERVRSVTGSITTILERPFPGRTSTDPDGTHELTREAGATRPGPARGV